jgi:poly(beta-D-mannuronate) lyase
MRSLVRFAVLAFLFSGLTSLPVVKLISVAQAQSVPGASLGATSKGKPLRKIVVSTQEEYAEVSKRLRPGDVVVLANGVWKDFDLVLDATGTAQNPVYLVAETPGDVTLTGQSSLRLAGEYIVVSGLVFRDGWSPRSEVISFRRDSKRLASRSRVTQIVIENYSNPDRSQSDNWVALFGQQNEFDHSHLVGKLNSGPTLVVRLDTEESRDNAHYIHHNYFGPRPVFGSNGGETLRIGTSRNSLFRSGTIVENNFFDRCNGEVEIISNKSGGNVFRSNTFYRSRGALTLRHGNDALVEGNLFDGGGEPYTGGVRIINARHVIRGNLFTNLMGGRFSGSLVIMNGVPNSPINRYHQVDGVVIEGNVFNAINRIELAEGADSERTARPVNTVFRNNTVVSADGVTPFQIYDDLSGIRFEGNVADVVPPASISAGFEIAETSPELPDATGYGVALERTGVSWYRKPSQGSVFEGGRVIDVQPGENTLTDAIIKADAGDTLVLAAGTYSETRTINLQFPLTIRGADAEQRPVITWNRTSLILLSGGGALRVENVIVDGKEAPDASGNSFIASTTMGGPGNHIVEIRGSSFRDFDVNRGFSVVSAAKGTFFDRVLVEGSNFADISGIALKFDAETDDYGIYNIEYLDIQNSRFTRIGSSVATVYRGGRDESTFGPHINMSNSVFDQVGKGSAPLLEIYGVQVVCVENNTATDVQPIAFTITTGKPKTCLSGNVITDAPERALLVTQDLRN